MEGEAVTRRRPCWRLQVVAAAFEPVPLDIESYGVSTRDVDQVERPSASLLAPEQELAAIRGPEGGGHRREVPHAAAATPIRGDQLDERQALPRVLDREQRSVRGELRPIHLQ